MRVLPFLLLFGYSATTKASTILASTFGYNTTNATAAFQAALQSPNDTIIIDLQAADWNVGPSDLFDLENKTLIFEPGVVLRAIPGAFNSTSACLLKLIRCHNITIIGYGATFRMNKAEYALLNDSEFRHSIRIENGVDITVKGLTLQESGGDGVYVGGDNGYGEVRNYSENIHLEDLTVRDHYRQGISVCSVEGLLVRHCLFTGTRGTLPEDGLDIEPYEPYQRLVDIVFEKCSFTDNDHAGIQITTVYMDASSLPISIAFRDCRTSMNGRPGHPYGPCEIAIGAPVEGPIGTVLFERCHVDSSNWTAVNMRKPSTSYTVTFNDCAFTNVSQEQVQNNVPLAAEVSDYFEPCPGFGGVAYNNCLVTYPTNFPYFQGFGWNTSPGPTDVDFSGTVVAPNGGGIVITNSLDTINCSFAANDVNTIPASTVNMLLLEQPGQECGPVPMVFEVSRVGNNITFPLPFRYTNAGDVIFGNDVHLMTGSITIPSGETAWTDTIMPRADDLAESPEFVTVTPLFTNYYSLGSFMPFSAAVYDCLGTAVEEDGPATIMAWPNPFIDAFTISGLAPGAAISVLDAQGRIVHVGPITKEIGHDWSPGVYTIRIDHNARRSDLRLIKAGDR